MTNRTGRPGQRTRNKPRRQWFSFVVAAVLALVTAAPMLLMVSGALKSSGDVFDGKLIPDAPTLANFAMVLTEVPFPSYLLNSFLLAAGVTVLAIICHSMAAFALARLRFRGRDGIFFAFFATILVSMPMIIVPLFIVVRELGLLDSYAGVALPMVFQAFALFLLRQFYLSMPAELEEAAKIDGAGPLGVYWRIALPLSRPVLSALAIFLFLGAWNAFLWPLTTISDQSRWVVQIGIASLQGEFAGEWNTILAASTVASVPTIVLFAVFQRQIIESIKTSGLK